MEKTNVLRILDNVKIEYDFKVYDQTITDGKKVADVLNLEKDQVFKTLVTISNSGKHYVFMVPVSFELDLKKAAKLVSEKNIQMIKQKELLPLTGYIHGGCSPIGMKKLFPTIIDESALLYDTIYFSGGKVGLQVKLDPKLLSKIIKIQFADII